MFVSIAVDSGSADRAKELADLLGQYGFVMVQKGLWESSKISPDTLNRVKRDLDRATDAFDRLRLFQFPLEGTLVISILKDKKWRRLVARDTESAAAKPPAASQTKAPQMNRRVRHVRRK